MFWLAVYFVAVLGVWVSTSFYYSREFRNCDGNKDQPLPAAEQIGASDTTDANRASGAARRDSHNNS